VYWLLNCSFPFAGITRFLQTVKLLGWSFCLWLSWCVICCHSLTISFTWIVNNMLCWLHLWTYALFSFTAVAILYGGR
jgi:hypothetical protein